MYTRKISCSCRLRWGWLAFNCGSTFGISGKKWILAAKAAITTLMSSMSGGIMGIVASFVVKKGKYDVSYLINAIIGSLVAVTASCPVVRPYEAVIIGATGAIFTLSCDELLRRLQIDDPVSAVAVHGGSGLWGLIAVGLFAEDDNVENLTADRNGLLHGGDAYLLGIQLMSGLCHIVWSGGITFILLFVIDKTIGLRVTLLEEMFGADYCEHLVGTTPDVNSLELPPDASFQKETVVDLSRDFAPAIHILNHYSDSCHGSQDLLYCEEHSNNNNNSKKPLTLPHRQWLNLLKPMNHLTSNGGYRSHQMASDPNENMLPPAVLPL